MALFGNIEAFNPKATNWKEYAERVEMYLYANDIQEKKQVAVFLTIIGGETYMLLQNLVSPEKPGDKTIRELMGILNTRLNPTPIIIAEQFKFYQRTQQEGETLSHYIAALRRLSENCEFKRFLNEAIRHKFVCSISSETIRTRLLSE